MAELREAGAQGLGMPKGELHVWQLALCEIDLAAPVTSKLTRVQGHAMTKPVL